MFLRWLLLLFFPITVVMNQAHAAGDCGTLENHYGPYDYTNPQHFREKLPIVERAHFTTSVETLTKGNTGKIHDDLDYTLRTFPNHHRALFAMAKYQLQTKRPPGARYYTAECYFLRAIKFKPDDGIVRLLYGIYLHRKGELQRALKRYKEAEKMTKESAELSYNLGLLYTDLKQYDKAYQYAKKAYGMGYPLPGLRNRLKRHGIWNQSKK